MRERSQGQRATWLTALLLFLQNLERLTVACDYPSKYVCRIMHRVIHRVTHTSDNTKLSRINDVSFT